MDKPEKKGGQPKFNTALGLALRLNKLLDLDQEAALTLDDLTWIHMQRAIYREIDFKLTDEERKYVDTLIQDATNEVNKHNQPNRNMRSITQKEFSTELYAKLDASDKKLRRLAYEHKLLMADKEKLEDFFDEDEG